MGAADAPLNMTNPDNASALDPVLVPLGLYGQSKGLYYGLAVGAVLGIVAGYVIGSRK